MYTLVIWQCAFIKDAIRGVPFTRWRPGAFLKRMTSLDESSLYGACIEKVGLCQSDMSERKVGKEECKLTIIHSPHH